MKTFADEWQKYADELFSILIFSRQDFIQFSQISKG
jgi:hypothetical protein